MMLRCYIVKFRLDVHSSVKSSDDKATSHINMPYSSELPFQTIVVLSKHLAKPGRNIIAIKNNFKITCFYCLHTTMELLFF